MMRAIFLFVGASLVVGICASSSTAQQVVVGAPFGNANSSFFENMGVGFGFNLRGGNVPADGGGPSSVVGLTAAGVPGGDLIFGQNLGGGAGGGGGQGGFAVMGPQGGFNLNFNLAQGSSRGFTSQAPSVTVMNGGTGSFSSGTLRPFVTSLIPVVGNWPGGHPSFVVGPRHTISPIAERMRRLNEDGGSVPVSTSVQEAPLPPSEEEHAALRLHAARGSTAGHGDVSVAAIHAQHAAEDAALEEEIAILIERGRGAEAQGKPNVARIYYQQAASRAEGELREQLLQQIQKLGGG